MKKSIIWIIAIVAVLVFWGVSVSNSIVEMRGQAQKQWSNVESAYQRRNDLIGNLVKTVQGAADFEKTTLVQVVEARAKATSISVDTNQLSDEALQQFQQAQSGLSSALSRLLVSMERYPDIKANANFLALQSQIEGTESRINVERNRYNEEAGNYNIYIRKIPNSIIARIFSYEPLLLFKAETGAEKAPKVEFDFKS